MQLVMKMTSQHVWVGGATRGPGTQKIPALAALQGTPALRHLTLSHHTNNVWLTGQCTEGGLKAFRAATPSAQVKSISC